MSVDLYVAPHNKYDPVSHIGLGGKSFKYHKFDIIQLLNYAIDRYSLFLCIFIS